MVVFNLLPLTLVLAVLDYVVVSDARSWRSVDTRQLPRQLLRRTVPSSSTFYSDNSTIIPVSLNTDDSSYFCLISAGNISFRVALDTASSDLWIISSACSSKSCKSVPSYPLSFHSPSFGIINNNSSDFNLSFADGTTATGFVATESVQLGNFTVPQQAIGLVNNTNVTLHNSVSGVLGLGFPRLSALSEVYANATPFLSTLAQQGELDYPFFGLSLTRNNTGTLSLGAVDAEVVQNVSRIEWYPVMPFSPFADERNTSTYLQWALPLMSIGVNGTAITPQTSYPGIVPSSLALLDVGTNGIFGPYQDVSRIFSLLDESRLVDDSVGQWAMPCDTEEVLTFNFGGSNFTLQPTDYLIAPITGDPNLCLTWPRATVDAGDGIDWQLGTPFLRTVYSVFSYGIDTKESPFIGLYALSNATTETENITQISSFFSSMSVTVSTSLPNFPLATQTPSPPAYIFNTSVPASLGQIEDSELGTSTYSPLFAVPTINASAIPTVSASPTLATFIITDASGAIITKTSILPTPSVVLGRPPGSSSVLSYSPISYPRQLLLTGVCLFLLFVP